MAAINDSTLLIIEAAARGTSGFKRIYMININGATAITSANYGSTSVEGLADFAGLAAQGIVRVKKTLFKDLLAAGWPAALDKAEGIVIINDSTIAISNDNDYGQTSPAANGIPTATTNLPHLVTYRLQGNNKLVNFIPQTPTPNAVAQVVRQSIDAKLYPNPVSGGNAVVEVKLPATSAVAVTLVNAQGRVVSNVLSAPQTADVKRFELPTAGLANGVYFVQIAADGKSAVLKLVVMH